MEQGEEFKLLEKYDNIGLDYIKKQKYYFKVSLIFSIFTLFMNILSVISFILNTITSEHFFIIGFFFFLNSSCFFLIITLISIKQTLFLRKWNESIRRYNEIKEESKQNRNYTTLTDIFYQIVHYMKEYRIYFIILNIIIAYYFILFPFLMMESFKNNSPHPPPEGTNGIEGRQGPIINFQILNSISFIIIFVYMLYLWYHFLHWNRKLRMLSKFERDLYGEIKKFFPI